MVKIAYKIDGEYKGIVTYDNVKKTDDELNAMRDEFLELEKILSKKCKHVYDSEYCYELGQLLDSKMKEYQIVESTRFNFWKMLRQNVNTNDSRKVFQEKQRDPYEHCYMLGKLPKELVLKFSMSKWDHLFDITTARKDDRLYNWMLNVKNEEFINNQHVFQNFCKCLKLYLNDIDTAILFDDEIYQIYDDAMNKSIILDKFSKSKKIKFNSKTRDEYFIKTKRINYRDTENLIEVLEKLL